MYPRNAASPPRIAVGTVVQIADGAVQTTGVSVVVRAEGGSETAGAGTLAVGPTSGVWYYTPTQAETNVTAFVVCAYKTGSIPASITVVTSASTTAGQVILAGVTHTSAVIPTVTTLTGHTAQTGDAFARIGATGSGLTSLAPSATALSTATWTATIAGRIDAAITTRMATYTQPTGFLAATFPGTVASTTNITAGTITTTTNLTNLPTAPANWLTASAVAADVVTEIWEYVDPNTGINPNVDTAIELLATASLGTMNAAGIRTAVGLASANLDTQLALRTGFKLASDGLDSVVVETGINARQALSPILGACAGVLSGAATNTITIKGGNSATDRITATVDSSGNRSAITLNLPT
jgi:hypothetical protein